MIQREISKGVDDTSQSLPVDLKFAQRASNQSGDKFLSFNSNASCLFPYFEASAKLSLKFGNLKEIGIKTSTVLSQAYIAQLAEKPFQLSALSSIAIVQLSQQGELQTRIMQFQLSTATQPVLTGLQKFSTFSSSFASSLIINIFLYIK